MTDTANVVASSEIVSAAAAFERVRDQILAVDPARTRPIRVDLVLLVTMMLGALPRLRALRPELARLYDFPSADFDQLEDFVYAVLYAHSDYVRETKPPTDLHALVPEATALRDVLHADATSLVRRKQLPQDALDDVRRANGHRALLLDLQILAAVFRNALPSVQGKSPVTEADLRRAEQLVIALSGAVGARDHAPALLAKSARLRNQAYTAFMQRYDHVRAAVEYVRRAHGDADLYLPSLFAGSGRRRVKRQAQQTESRSEGVDVETEAKGETGARPAPEQIAAATLSR